MSDREIYEPVVCLTYAEAGVLLLSGEADGGVSGARHRHGTTTDRCKLQAAILNHTEPPVNAQVSVPTMRGQPAIAIDLDAYPTLTWGLRD